jgi:hypothetical protein
MRAVSDHISPWANAILVPNVAGSPLSAVAALTAVKYGAAPLAVARSTTVDTDVRRLEAMIGTETRRVRTPEEQQRDTIPALVELIRSNAIDSASLDKVIQAVVSNDELLAELIGMNATRELVRVVRLARQQRGLDELTAAIRAPDTDLETIRRLLWREWWVFGGTLVAWVGDDVVPEFGADVIPLITFDAAIHFVVAEDPRVADLVTKVGDHHRLSPRIAAAFDRARYLVRRLEEQKESISARLRINCGRAVGTILIGHPTAEDEVDATVQQEEIRVLNTFVNNVSVMTYEELLTVAQQTLKVGDAEVTPAATA